MPHGFWPIINLTTTLTAALRGSAYTQILPSTPATIPLVLPRILYWQGTTSSDGVPMAVEQAVYDWIYDDSGSAWGHRHAVLWEPIEDNGGPVGLEGFLGIGHVRGGFTDPWSGQYFPNTDLVVMNVFDPCADWTYTAPPDIAAPPPPQDVETPDPPANTHSVSGNAAAPTWVTITRQPFEMDTWPGQWQASDANGSTERRISAGVPAHVDVYDGSYSGMAAGGGLDGSPQSCEGHYPNNARSWLIYGPFSLADAIAAELRATVWVNTELNTDLLCLMTSIDDEQYKGICVSGSSDDWVEERLDLNKVSELGSVLGRSQVYVAVLFWSDESVTYPGQGGFVDNIELRKAMAGATLERRGKRVGRRTVWRHDHGRQRPVDTHRPWRRFHPGGANPRPTHAHCV